MAQADSASPKPQNNTLKWVALGCGGCLGITVLAGVALTVLLSRMVRFAVGPDQADVDSQELFVYALPGESQSIFTMDILGIEMSQVASTDSPPSVLLTMGKLPRYLQDQAARDTFIDQFQEQVTVEGSYQLGEQRVEERTLCGQPVSVLLQSGRFEQGANAHDAASLLTFVDYNDTVRFVWLLTHGDTPAATADQVFSSLDCR
ncbi:hypothetical protein IQ254_14530 [Nodosilinea sp. LEGE 07088]|uniref:hypothetical protein n=1 Tax=Nodosilinea sp. LEGE 07088 TaxID=2777968 RepID=UPI001880AD56|nr:hypothetical protein [Nodosilinea sp. LEGE 07088]MBE9138389.1 hypothetical protein [Nodosilinea sp. LEGE 07088]